MKESVSRSRLRRFIGSGLCISSDSGEYVKEMRKILGEINESEIKRQSYALKALADVTRIKILRLLKTRPMCACEITAALGLTQPNASHHLEMLERNGILKSRRTGRWTFYELQKSVINDLTSSIVH
jgi:ArsR family transcriptional regulator